MTAPIAQPQPVSVSIGTPSVVGRVAMRAGQVFLLTFILLGATAVGLALYAASHADRMYQGVTVAGVDVGGMTETQARAAVEREFQAYLVEPILLSYDETQFALIPRDAGISLDIGQSVDAAFSYARHGSWWNRSADWARALIEGEHLPAVLQVDQPRLIGTLSTISGQIAKPPVDAYVLVNRDGEPMIVSEEIGVSYDVGGTMSAVLERVAQRSEEPVPVVALAIPASVTKASLEAGLPLAKAAVEQPLIIAGLGQEWAISQEDLKRIVSVSGAGGVLQVDRVAVSLLVNGIATEISHPPVNAKVVIDDQGVVSVVPSDDSVEVDVQAAVDEVVRSLERGTHRVELSITRTEALVSDEEAEAARAKIESLVASGIELTWKGGSATISRYQLLAAMTIEVTPEAEDPFVIGLSAEVLQATLTTVAEAVYVPGDPARLRYVNGKVVIEGKATTGQELDIGKALKGLQKAVLSGKTTYALPVTPLQPAYSEAEIAKIRLPDLLAEAKTYYGNSSDARRENIERAVELETGWLVEPGAMFSFAEHVGAVTKENGFVTGLGILDDGNGGITTGPVIGGGICQVSTTIFQAAFWSGLIIVERYSHPYWLQAYGQPPSGMLGLDAMVNIEESGSLDLKFRNNTGYWIAVEIIADGQNVTARIVGKDPGWKVRVDGPEITNIVEPNTDTIFTDSPELPLGEERQVETAQQGFDATIRRVVTDKKGVLVDDFTLSSRYVAGRNRILRGTGS